FMHSPLKSHLKTAFKILKYLKGCPGLGIHFVKTSGMSLSAFSDADWAKVKSKTLSKSSTGAEYRALASVTSKVYEYEIKGKSSSSSNSQNVAFVSSDNSSSTNETVNTAHSVSAASSKDQASTASYADDVMFSFFANQSNAPQLDCEDLEQMLMILKKYISNGKW
ncbi:hypothetical protein Tco_1387925, partial [Tanacetum coccineum]